MQYMKFIILTFLFNFFSASYAQTSAGSSILGGPNPLLDIVVTSDSARVRESLLSENEKYYPFPHLSRFEQAAIFGFDDIIIHLINEDPEIFTSDAGSSLYSAASLGRLSTVILFLEKGVSPDYKLDSSFTPMYPAVQFGHKSIVLKLLEYGADINYRADNGLSLIVLAFAEKRLDMICLLLSKGYVPTKQEEKMVKNLECK